MFFERDSPARHPWRGGGSPPVLVAGPATLQQCKKEQSLIRRQKVQKAYKPNNGNKPTTLKRSANYFQRK
jgi:hypothetical protein